MNGRWTIGFRTGIVVASVSTVTFIAVFAGGGDGPAARARGDAPAGAGAAPAAVAQPLARTRATSGPMVQTVTPSLSPLLRDLPPPSTPTTPPLEIEQPDLPAPQQPASQPSDGALQKTFGLAAMPAPTATFEGINNDENPGTSLVIPPDVEGDVGPNHYVEWVNLVYSVYDRAGTRLVGPTAGNMIFSALPSGKCKTTNSGDPLVLYDQLADRWVLTQFTGSAAPFFQCVAVSTSPDPAGTYCLYPFQVSTTVFNDYPKVGLWPDAYYFSGAGFPAAGFTPQAYAVERDAMLACQAADMVYFDNTNSTAIASSSLQRMLPSDLDGSTPPPAGSPNYYLTHDDTNDRLELYKFHVDWTTLANSTFTKIANIPVPAFDTAFTCNAVQQTRQCIPQLGTTNRLDVLSTRLMYRLAYRNFGTHESLVVNQSVDANDPLPDHAAVRWYEIRDPNGPPVLKHAGTFAPDTDHRWMGSAAQDRQGNMAVGYSHSGPTVFPSIRWAGRLAGDPANQLSQGEATMFLGAGPQIAAVFTPPSGPARWGDYTHMSIDPVDDCTFWYINEYYSSEPLETSQGIWRTRVGHFKFPSCSTTTAAKVTRFGARWRGANVVVSWGTAAEVDTLGYNVYRSVGSGPLHKLSRTLIPARRAGQPLGAAYRYVDRAVKRGTAYTYRLQTVAANGKRSWYAIGSAAAG